MTQHPSKITPKSPTDTTSGTGSSDAKAARIDEAIETTGDAVKSTAQELKSGAEDILDSARDTADTTAERVSNAVDRASDTLRGAANSLREGSLQERTFGQLAASLADASDAIRDRDLGQLSKDVSSYARNNPIVFIGGAALLGFAVANMMNKSRQQS
ncbi:hypothetical protein CLV78_10758 [Aliiruegeria haliotis]|uniref:ElaB/YqjD/DUF883 family membrane-anchored ribosome-binding protein n=1 Tax=Aliiruegeria haliotis TaxID=1280846 RepID=A0A2T0RLS1_9RHOB|nr:hypothetical protein [Aliiruegeria haliotis]PRY22134.1 hypothetical protein CLV78_10758 [Aliiruegeria haliotis]